MMQCDLKNFNINIGNLWESFRIIERISRAIGGGPKNLDNVLSSKSA
jgi:hypothetical protein